MPAPEATGVRPPSRFRYFYGWNIVAACFASNLLTAGVYWQGFQVFFLPMLAEFGWSRTLFSLAFSFRQVEVGVGAPLVGVLVDRFGARATIVASGLLTALGMALIGFTWDIYSFYLFFLLASLGASGTSHAVSWIVAIARWFRRRRGTAVGIAMSGPALSGVALMGLEWMVSTWGWRPAIFVSAALVLAVVVPLAYVVVRNTPEELGMHPDGEAPAGSRPAGAEVGPTGAPHVESDNLTVGQALRTRNFWAIVVVFSCIFFGHSGIQVHQVALFHDDIGLDTGAATLLLGLTFLVSVVGRIGAGVVSDFLDLRLVLAGIVAINVTAWAYLNFAPITGFWTALPFALLYAVPFGATVSIRPLLMAKLFGPRAMGTIMGLFQMITLCAAILGPVFMGWVFDQAQTYRPSLLAFVVSSAVALPFVFLVRPQKPAALPAVV